MSDQPVSDSAAGKSVNGALDPIAPAQTPASPTQGAESPTRSPGLAKAGNRRWKKLWRFFKRLNISAWANVLVGVGSLVVSCFTYKVSADTSDLKQAVGKLTALASESRRQADAAQGQFTLAQKSNRPFVFLRLKSMFLHSQSGGAGSEVYSIISQFNFTNYGTGPAIISKISYGIFFDGHGNIENNSTLAGTPLLNGDSTQDFYAAQQFRPGEEFDFNAARVKVIFRGIVIYADISDRPGKTWFCYRFIQKSFADGWQPVPVELSDDCTNKHE